MRDRLPEDRFQNETIVLPPCEYFTRYGNACVPGSCSAPATLALLNNPTRPMIVVCALHAEVIVSRFPDLGDVCDRFVPI